eukprot:3612414-Pyramimonas_sp.AAC.1
MGDITNDDSEVTIPRNYPSPPRVLSRQGALWECSPPRVSPLLRRYQVKAQGSWDLTTGWDFRLERHQRKAKAHVRRETPWMLMLEPPCYAFSQIQSLNKGNEPSEEVLRKQAEGMQLL